MGDGWREDELWMNNGYYSMKGKEGRLMDGGVDRLTAIPSRFPNTRHRYERWQSRWGASLENRAEVPFSLNINPPASPHHSEGPPGGELFPALEELFHRDVLQVGLELPSGSVEGEGGCDGLGMQR